MAKMVIANIIDTNVIVKCVCGKELKVVELVKDTIIDSHPGISGTLIVVACKVCNITDKLASLHSSTTVSPTIPKNIIEWEVPPKGDNEPKESTIDWIGHLNDK